MSKSVEENRRACTEKPLAVEWTKRNKPDWVD